MDNARLDVSEVGIARAVVAEVRSVSGVADVSPGRFAETATYGPGERVRGVAVTQAAGVLNIEVHLCARYSESLVLPELASRVRSAVRRSIEDLGIERLGRIDVAFDDLQVEDA